MEETKKEAYPRYYWKPGRVIKVINETETRTIILQPASSVAERFITRYANSDRLSEDLKDLSECTDQKFKEYLFAFYQQVDNERRQLNAQLYQTLATKK